MKPLSFIIVGSGWRAMFFARIAGQYPEQFRLKYMLCRSEEKAQRLQRESGVPATASAEVCEAARPDFVVTAVTRSVLYETTKEWIERGYPVLSETPVCTSVDQLEELWRLKKEKGARVQVAEQYHRYPIIAAGLRAIHQGKIGDPYAAVLSVAHDYHGASLLRRMLDIGPEPMKLRGKTIGFPVTETDSRQGPVTDGSVTERPRTAAMIEYASGKLAYYDFSGVQYHSFIRSRHLNVQGRDGEWNDTMLRYVDAGHRPQEERLTAFLDSSYQILHTEEMIRQSRQWSPFLTLDQAQDEYAIASMMLDMRAFLETGKEVYPLEEALEDAYTWLLLEEACAHPGAVIESKKMPWHR